MSADGEVVVGQSSSASGGEAFRWTAATGMVGLGDLPGGAFAGGANATSADGQVVVGQSSSASVISGEAFLWTAEDGMRSLHDLLATDLGLDLTGWRLITARAISSDGRTIVGLGRNPNNINESWIATIPEPGTFSLLAFGGLFLLRRKR